MNQTIPVVLKLGGSLLTLPDLAERLRGVLEFLQPYRILIVPGGGAAADEIRRLDDRWGLTATQAHWMAIEAMTFNTHLISRSCGCLPVASNRFDAETIWRQHQAVLLDPRVFLQTEHVADFQTLPTSWSVTSDSIAAFVAWHWPAQQIVFCKSCNPISLHIERLCQHGLLDAWLPNLLPHLEQCGVKLQWLNLQSAHPRLDTLRTLSARG